MKEGLLWYDTDQTETTTESVLSQAADAYRRKFGADPDTVHIHPDQMNGAGPYVEDPGVWVWPKDTVQEYHYFVGVERSEEK